MMKHLLLCAFVMLSFTARAGDAPFKADKLAAMDAEITQAIRDGTIVGATLWVERKGTSHHRAYGNRALLPNVEAMTEDTIFDAASVTKVVATATAAMLCVERDLMRLDDPVSRFLPEFTGEGREKITIKHLLLHTSGLQVNLNGTKKPLSRSPVEAYAQACREKPRFEPGSAFSYSSLGSMVLGMAIERASGRTYEAFCTAEIFQPLKMHDTLFTTPGDLARFARMMLNGGELDSVRLFKPETIQLMTHVQTPPDLRSPDANNLPVKRALGWDIDTPYRTPPHDYSLARGALFPIGSYGHTGWTGQMLWIDPFSETFIVFLCNRYVPSGKETRSAVSKLHHRLSTLAAEAVQGFDFSQVPGASSKAERR